MSCGEDRTPLRHAAGEQDRRLAGIARRHQWRGFPADSSGRALADLTTSPRAEIRTLAEMFDEAGRSSPECRVRSLLTGESVRFADLGQDGRAVGAGLVASGVDPGTPVLVLVKSPADLLRALHGVVAAGAVVAPLSLSVGFTKAYLTRLGHIVENCGARHAIVDDQLEQQFRESLPNVTTFTLDALRKAAAESGKTRLPATSEQDLALIQYTSGSTSNPRGVALTHRNILASLRAMAHATAATPADILCHWLPLSHDMGLFSSLCALAVGMEIYLSRPEDFIKYPDEWLRRFSEVRATVMAGPNFAYQYLMDVIGADEAAEYDLSSVRVILNGAEPIDPGLLTAFPRHFAASHLNPRAMTPCYGLAEATLAVTFASLTEPPEVDWVNRAALNSVGDAWPVSTGAPEARAVVCCGTPQLGMSVRIVRDGIVTPERTVGEIQIRGECVMAGYYREARPTVSPDGWCPTGDLGYLAEGQLFVTGRLKEMIIVSGRNYYPHDIEEAVTPLPGLFQRRAIAVVLPPEPAAGAPERIAVLAEVESTTGPFGPILSRIRTAAASQLEGASVDIVLLRRGGLLRTTSGKFQRVRMRDLLIAGELSRVLFHLPANERVPADDATS